MGDRLRKGLEAMSGPGGRVSGITSVRGRGLMNAIIVDDTEDGTLANEACYKFMANGLLAKPTHGNIIRLAPPLCITEAQVDESLDIIEKSFLSL